MNSMADETTPRSLEERLPAPVRAWLGPCIVVIVGVLLLRWSWLKWADLLVDSGQQLYVAWTNALSIFEQRQI